MEKKKFICPVCGKATDTPAELANCILADEKKNKELEEKRKAEEKQERINELEEDIKITYEELKNLVDEFNELSTDKNYITSCETAKKLVVKARDYNKDLDKLNENLELFFRELF